MCNLMQAYEDLIIAKTLELFGEIVLEEKKHVHVITMEEVRINMLNMHNDNDTYANYMEGIDWTYTDIAEEVHA